KHCLLVQKQLAGHTKRIIRSQLAEQLVEIVLDYIQAVGSVCRSTDLSFGIEEKVCRQILLSRNDSLIVIECAWLREIETCDGVADCLHVLFSFRLRHVHGDYAHPFALSLIANLCNL